MEQWMILKDYLTLEDSLEKRITNFVYLSIIRIEPSKKI